MSKMTPETSQPGALSSSNANPKAEIKKGYRGGLEGIVAASTSISKVEGTEGVLLYRGYNIHDLARSCSFEEVAYLLWFAHLPNQGQLSVLRSQLISERTMPLSVWKILRDMSSAAEPMDALRTGISAWGASTIQGKPTLQQAVAVTARFPVVLAAFHRIRSGQEPIDPRPDLGHAANYIYMLTGKDPEPQHVRALDAYLVLLADHGMNASTFAGRVVASTESDIVSAVTAAVGALKGPLHGGAPSKVLDMLQAIGTAENAENWLRDSIERGDRLMGFGHRVYKTTDPRAEELRELARLADPQKFVLSRRVEELALELLDENKPGRKLYTNVEFYSAVLLASVGLPGDLFTPAFAISRVAGWTAHILEQVGDNRLIRPEADYMGPYDLKFVPLSDR